ncbi:NAD(P)H-dependent oxidoreductase [Vibrio sp. SS-MA-C1-2]|uniref:NAD(P)H-dependent oxidoreductase n=1 Tax=Vibrio sp. SS-MA-C1-2 TaxID=2908646 RepID=UPI001F41005C|nr:NAD(P)H-dependent oxidoreductase [Vibrio sp. SS-MA-C1-2]UJF17027.1 NAD(P)H-dependent oxidoreductase [Vibrio sp. SS-MA-C1-2]
MSNNRVLVLYAHPSPTLSEINYPLFKVAQEVEGVTAVDLYYEYPTYNINIEREQKRLLDHDIIIFQFPFYWYSTPSILKEWQDLVLEYGFAYGSEGNALKGKHFLCAISTGGKKEDYQTGGSNNYPLEELLRPLEQMANMTKMTYCNPIVLYSARAHNRDEKLDRHQDKWQALLEIMVKEGVQR